jgi:hypothetical protein
VVTSLTAGSGGLGCGGKGVPVGDAPRRPEGMRQDAAITAMSMEHAQVVSERVVRYSFDQFTSLPALDRIALAAGSE